MCDGGDGVQVWSTKNVDGVHRFLARVYRMCTGEISNAEPTRDHLRLLHNTIKRVRMSPLISSRNSRLCSTYPGST